jgi:hypothetical protein
MSTLTPLVLMARSMHHVIPHVLMGPVIDTAGDTAGAHGTQHAACGMLHAACGAQTLAASQSSAFSYSLFCLLLLNAAHTALAGVVWSQSGSRVAGLGGEEPHTHTHLGIAFFDCDFSLVSFPHLPNSPPARQREREQERERERGGERERGVRVGFGHGPCRAERRHHRPTTSH